MVQIERNKMKIEPIKMKKVLLIGLTYPNIKENTHLYTDLMHEFHGQGHEVTVIAPDDKNRKKSEIVFEGGIRILRVPTLSLFGSNKIIKGLSNILLSSQFKKAFKKHKLDSNFDLIIAHTPPINLIDFALWLKNKSKAKFYLILRDIFPQNAVDLKMMIKGGIIYTYFRKKEIELYKQSDKIGCMSPANVEFIKKNNEYLDFTKLHLLPNWENLHDIKRNIDEEKIREKYGLKNKIVAIFGGNIGKPQRVENILLLAQQSQELKDLVFFIIGNGTEKEKILKMVEQLKLSNVILKDSLPRQDYNDILVLADIGLISLNQDFTIPNFPSKVNAYYNFKKPILASVDVNTDFGIIQEKIKSGFYSIAGDTASFKKNLVKLYSNKELRETLGQNGYNYMKEQLSPEIAYKTILNQFR